MGEIYFPGAALIKGTSSLAYLRQPGDQWVKRIETIKHLCEGDRHSVIPSMGRQTGVSKNQRPGAQMISPGA